MNSSVNFSPRMLKPGSNFDTKPINRTLDCVLSDRNSNGSHSLEKIKARQSLLQNSVPQHNLSRRSGSTYGDTYEDSPAKRSKGKELNLRSNFKLQQLSMQCKFPSIPKSTIAEEYITKNSIQERLHDHGYLSKLDKSMNNAKLNKTLDNGISVRIPKTMKNGNMHQRKSTIFDQINQSTSLGGIYSKKNMHYNIEPLLKANIDRPKVSPLQDTLHGVLQTNTGFKDQQRKLQRYKHWAGMKIPVNSQCTFNRHKASMNRWDEQRDGIFYKL